MEPPRNRKQRRAAASAMSNQDAFDPSSIPLAHPPQTRQSKQNSGGKTLVDIIREKQNKQLATAGSPGTIHGLETKFVTIDPASGEISPFDASGVSELNEEELNTTKSFSSKGGSLSEEHQEETDPPIPPFLDTMLLSIPLTTLHLTLAYLAAHQYAVEIEMDKLLRQSGFVALPMLTLIIHLAHGHIFSFTGGRAKNSEVVSLFPLHWDKFSFSFFQRLLFPPALRTMVFLPLAIFLGTKLMEMTNGEPYYAVMKRAPAIGTLWVWCILEVPVGAAALGALGPIVWGVWWRGYGII